MEGPVTCNLPQASQGKVLGVSLGPGEPELITLKALKALQGADIIYCPGTQTKSRSRDILQAPARGHGTSTTFPRPHVQGSHVCQSSL